MSSYEFYYSEQSLHQYLQRHTVPVTQRNVDKPLSQMPAAILTNISEQQPQARRQPETGNTQIGAQQPHTEALVNKATAEKFSTEHAIIGQGKDKLALEDICAYLVGAPGDKTLIGLLETKSKEFIDDIQRRSPEELQNLIEKIDAKIKQDPFGQRSQLG